MCLFQDRVLKDDRFSALFSDPDYTINKESYEYRMLNHNMTRQQEKKAKKTKIIEKFDEVDTKAKSEKTKVHEHDWNTFLVLSGACIQDVCLLFKNGDGDVKKPRFFEIKEGDSLKDLTQKTGKQKKSR